MMFYTIIRLRPAYKFSFSIPGKKRRKMAAPGEVVIKYHWLSTLKTKPPLKIERFDILDDPIRFIRIYNGEVRDFEIYNAY